MDLESGKIYMYDDPETGSLEVVTYFENLDFKTLEVNAKFIVFNSGKRRGESLEDEEIDFQAIKNIQPRCIEWIKDLFLQC